MSAHREDESASSSAARAFESKIRDVLPDLERVYTDIHAHPELSMQETRTAGIAADRLRASGFEVTPGVGTTGVVGMLRNGDGPTIMLYALAALAGAAGAILCFGMRLIAIRCGWNLPSARLPLSSEANRVDSPGR